MKQIRIFLKRIYSCLRGEEKTRRYGYLFETIKEAKCRRIMEIGTWNGERGLQMIKTAQKFHAPEEVEYYGFDIFELMNDEICVKEVSKKPPIMEEVKNRLETSGAKIYVFKGFTEEVMPKIMPSLPKMDFVFIDGGHSIETITNDWNYTQQVMDGKTIVIFDDYWSGEWGKRKDAGCQSLIDSLDRSRFEVKILPVTDSFRKDWGMLFINFALVRILPISPQAGRAA